MAQNENNLTQDEHDKVKDFQGAGHNLNPIKTTVQTMRDEQYIRERVDDQISYFGSKASKSQKKYKKLKRWEIFIAATIPVLIAFSALSIFEHTVFKSNLVVENGVEMLKPIFTLSTIFQIIAAIGGIIIVVLKGLVDLEDYYKTWKDFRSVEMTLQQEKYKFVTRTEPYDETDAYGLLVEEVEQTLNKENQKWRSVKKPTNKFSDKAEEALLAEFDKQRKQTSISIPVSKPTTKPVIEEVVQPEAKKAEPIPVTKEVVEPVAKEVVEPVTKEVVEPITKEVVEPVTKEVVEPISEKGVDDDFDDIDTNEMEDDGSFG